MQLRSGFALRLCGLLLLVLSISAGPAQAATSSGWQWPLAGVPAVLRPFQPPPGPYAAGHRGVDLAAATGAAVLAAGQGVVGFAGMVAGRGVVTVVHGALKTTYEPVTAAVRAGQPVSGGQQIGRLQPPTGHCGPGRSCLHWGLLRGSVYLDPLALLGRTHSVLLPMWGQHPPHASGAVTDGVVGGVVAHGAAGVHAVTDRPPAANSGRPPDPAGSSWPAITGAVLLGVASAAPAVLRRRRRTGYD